MMQTGLEPQQTEARHRIAVAAAAALLVAGLVLVMFVLPAEFGVDPLGTGARFGLVELGLTGQRIQALEAAEGGTTGGQPIIVAQERPFQEETIEFTHAPYDYKTAFGESVRARAEALLVLASGNFVAARRQIPELAIQHRLPTMFGNNLWARAGGLLSYGPDFSHFYQRAAEQVARILNGARPADLPIEQPTRFELVINLRTAKALGLALPRSLLVRADDVIQ